VVGLVETAWTRRICEPCTVVPSVRRHLVSRWSADMARLSIPMSPSCRTARSKPAAARSTPGRPTSGRPAFHRMELGPCRGRGGPPLEGVRRSCSPRFSQTQQPDGRRRPDDNQRRANLYNGLLRKIAAERPKIAETVDLGSCLSAGSTNPGSSAASRAQTPSASISPRPVVSPSDGGPCHRLDPITTPLAETRRLAIATRPAA
jgi:hypothetical protein